MKKKNWQQGNKNELATTPDIWEYAIFIKTEIVEKCERFNSILRLVWIFLFVPYILRGAIESERV